MSQVGARSLSSYSSDSLQDVKIETNSKKSVYVSSDIDKKLPSVREDFEVNKIPSSTTCKSNNQEKVKSEHNPVIEGKLSFFDPIDISILYETFPWWLFGLDGQFTRTIFIPQHSSMISFRNDLKFDPKFPMIDKIVESLGQYKFIFGKFNIKTMFLLSGSINKLSSFPFLPQILTSNNYIYVCDELRKFRYLPPSPFKLHRFHHKNCGGAVNLEIVWGSSFDSKQLHQIPLRRTIKDYVNYGTRPKNWKHGVSKFLYHDRLLPINFPHAPVRYPSTFTASGFGIRSLDASELAAIFGLPSPYWTSVSLKCFPMLPIQILEHLLRSFLKVSTTP